MMQRYASILIALNEFTNYGIKRLSHNIVLVTWKQTKYAVD